MLSIDLKTPVALLLIGFVLGFFTSFFFKGCGSNGNNKTENIIQPKELKKQAEDAETKYQEKIAGLENKNKKLQHELTSTKSQLEQTKKKTVVRETKIKKIIEPNGFPAKELLKKVNGSVTGDSSLSPCDSLVEEVSEYIRENSEKDSLYELQITQLDSIIGLKDSIIVSKTELYQNMQSLFNQSLQQQEKLLQDNQKLRRQFKRQKFKNRLVTIAGMIVSGIAVNYLIHH